MTEIIPYDAASRVVKTLKNEKLSINLSLSLSVRTACTSAHNPHNIVVHNIAHIRSDNLPSYLPDNRHSPDSVYTAYPIHMHAFFY